MNEVELAERFNAELDGVFQGGGGVYFSPDPGAMELAAALARADFSGESAIKESMRTRLAGGYAAPGEFAAAMRALLRNSYARLGLATACLLLALLPLIRRPGVSPVPPTSLTAARAVPPAGAAARKFSTRTAASTRVAAAAADPGVFYSVPMARLEGEPIQSFPIESAGAGNPIVLAAGREVRLENGSGVVWETENAIFTYERRVISLDELFQRKSI